MALNPTQQVAVAEITQEAISSLDFTALTEHQETSIIADIATWAEIRDSHVKLTKDVDFDNERKREAIRQRVRKALGLSLVSEEALALNGGVLSIFELEVGSNFG